MDVASSNPFRQAVDYYRCDPCGHVWSQIKSAPAVNVTKMSGKPSQPQR
jgi:hypothetical protein